MSERPTRIGMPRGQPPPSVTLLPSGDGRFCLATCAAARDASGSGLPSAAAADAQGLRPCPGCRPERVPLADAAAASGRLERRGSSATLDARRVADAIAEAAPRGLDAAALARHCGLSPAQLGRLTHRCFGASPARLLRWQRLTVARRLLDDSDAAPSLIARLAGYAGAATMQRALARRWSDDPLGYRQTLRGRRRETAAPLHLWLPAAQPFAGALLTDFLAVRALPGVEIPDIDATGENAPDAGDRAYRRSWCTERGAGSVRLLADSHGVALRIDGSGTLPIEDLLLRARRLFDIDAPAAAIAALLGRDARLAAAVRACPGRRVPGCWDPFELAVRAVLGQQVSVAAARTHAIRLVALCAPTAGQFPSPEGLLGTDLAPLAMPGARKRALAGLARAVVERALDFRAPTAQVRAALLAIPGIGPWTADYIAMRGLEDPDAFPAGDLVVRQALAVEGALPSIRATEVRSHGWRPYRAYAVMHLWATAGSSAGG